MNSSEFSTALSALAVDALLGDGFRLLKDGEVFEPGDEMLCDAIKEWLPLPIREKTTMKWYASQYVPVRRRSPNNAKYQSASHKTFQYYSIYSVLR